MSKEKIKNPTFYVFVIYKFCVIIFLIDGIGSLKKEIVKRQDKNLEYSNDESGMLPLQPIHFRNTNSQQV